MLSQTIQFLVKEMAEQKSQLHALIHAIGQQHYHPPITNVNMMSGIHPASAAHFHPPPSSSSPSPPSPTTTHIHNNGGTGGTGTGQVVNGGSVTNYGAPCPSPAALPTSPPTYQAEQLPTHSLSGAPTGTGSVPTTDRSHSGLSQNTRTHSSTSSQ